MFARFLVYAFHILKLLAILDRLFLRRFQIVFYKERYNNYVYFSMLNLIIAIVFRLLKKLKNCIKMITFI